MIKMAFEKMVIFHRPRTPVRGIHLLPGITSPSLISPALMNGDHQDAPFVTPPPSNGSGALFDDDDDDDDDLFPSTKITNNQVKIGCVRNAVLSLGAGAFETERRAEG